MKIEDFPFDEIVEEGKKIHLRDLISKIVKVMFGGKLVEVSDEQGKLIPEIIKKFWSLDMVEEKNISGFSIAKSRFASKFAKCPKDFLNTNHTLHFKWIDDSVYQEFEIYSTGVPKSHL